MIKLNLGCAKVSLPGFVNIDICEGKNVHIVHDATSLPMFTDNSIDLIYASALFQYFDFHEGEKCLKEWHRVLKPGGTLRISTADFDKLIKVYNKFKDIDDVIGPLYGRMPLKNKNMSENIQYHKTVYTKSKLEFVLRKCGFSDINEYDWKNTIHNKYDDQSQAYFPHKDKENGIHIMQNWEAIK